MLDADLERPWLGQANVCNRARCCRHAQVPCIVGSTVHGVPRNSRWSIGVEKARRLVDDPTAHETAREQSTGLCKMSISGCFWKTTTMGRIQILTCVLQLHMKPSFKQQSDKRRKYTSTPPSLMHELHRGKTRSRNDRPVTGLRLMHGFSSRETC